MRKLFFLLMGTIVASISFTNCKKESEKLLVKDTRLKNGVDESNVKHVPFFELQKGDSIEKGIWREKPICEDCKEETTILYSSEISNRAFGNASNPNNYPLIGMKISSEKHAGVPSGYIPVDLNEGAGGRFIYLKCTFGLNKDDYYVREILGLSSWQPIFNTFFQPSLYHVPLELVSRRGSSLPADVNKGAGGPYIYIAKNYHSTKAPVIHVRIVSSNSSTVKYEGWTKVLPDLNKGAGGKYIYLFYNTGEGDPSFINQ